MLKKKFTEVKFTEGFGVSNVANYTIFFPLIRNAKIILAFVKLLNNFFIDFILALYDHYRTVM